MRPVLLENFDCHHHALVFVFDNMAVKNETADNFRIGERNDELRLARFSIFLGWNAKGVPEAVEIGRNIVDFCDQKSGLMNMKVMVLSIFVEDCPFFGVAQLHGYVRSVLIKDLVVNKELCFLWVH